MNEIKKIVVVGGGTAGWLSALFFAKNYPSTYITVIESKDIGIIGAGEGVVPSVLNFIEELDIEIGSLFKEAKATFKNGIKFTNWNGDGTHYFHSFGETFHVNNVSHIKHLETVDRHGTLDSTNLSALNSEEDRVNLIFKKTYSHTLKDFEANGNFAVHFDAHLLAEFLKKVGIERGITVIDDTVVDIVNDYTGYIKKIICTKEMLEPDFVIDCTGLQRVVIGKHYSSEWVSWSDKLVNKKAIPFFLPLQSSTPPYTESIAMKYGWVWKIPVQGRYGCGYVYDSDLITDEEAKKEVEDYFNQEINFPRILSFNPGYFKTPWVNNCIAVGLSSGFFEPLEATNIWVVTESLLRLLNHLPGIIFRDIDYINKYNDVMISINEEIADFILLHYVTDRTDTEYWKRFKNKSNLTSRVNHIIKNYNAIYPITSGAVNNITNGKLFTFESYQTICLGSHIYRRDKLRQQLQSLLAVKDIDSELVNFLRYQEYLHHNIHLSIRHDDAINHLKGKNEN